MQTKTPVEPKLLTIREAAEILSLSEQHVYTLTYQKRLPVVRIGTHAIRIHRGDLVRFIEKHRSGEISEN